VPSQTSELSWNPTRSVVFLRIWIYDFFMQGVNQSVLISAAFVEIADCLVGKYDALDVLRTLVDHCVAVLDVTAAGIVLADEAGNLQVLASTSEASQHVELLQHKAGTGPCIDSYRYGKVITLSDIKAQGDRYPAFQAAALSRSCHSDENSSPDHRGAESVSPREGHFVCGRRANRSGSGGLRNHLHPPRARDRR